MDRSPFASLANRVVMESDVSPRVYVDAVAALLAMPLDAQSRPVVVAAMERLAAFAADVAAVDLGLEVEIAGVFIP